MKKAKEKRLEALAHEFLTECIAGNVDWSAAHLQDTPKRFVKMLREMTTGPTLEFTTFPNTMKKDEMIICSPIQFSSLCAHHLIPFFGQAHIAYIPSQKDGSQIVGLSKLARAVHFWSKGLWTQEDLTDAIAHYLDEMLEPHGLGVIMEAEHMCMTIRGVHSPGTKTITSCMQGVLLDPERGARQEFLQLVAKGR